MPLPSWLGLLLTGAVLAAAALLAASVERQPRLRSFLDGFVLVSVGGLCLLFLFPEALAALGVGALPWGGLGLALPWASERLLAASGGAEHRWVGPMLGVLGGLISNAWSAQRPASGSQAASIARTASSKAPSVPRGTACSRA